MFWSSSPTARMLSFWWGSFLVRPASAEIRLYSCSLMSWYSSHQDPPEAGHDVVPLLVGVRTVGSRTAGALALQDSGGLNENVGEEVRLRPAAGWAFPAGCPRRSGR